MGIEKRHTIYTCDICGNKKEHWELPVQWNIFGLGVYESRDEQLIKFAYWGGDSYLVCDECWGKNLPSNESKEKQFGIFRKLWNSVKLKDSPCQNQTSK